MPRPIDKSLRISPKPLLATPSADLDSARDDMPVSKRFDDIYYSVDDGLEETRNVYLKACGLPQRWDGADQYIIGELGFGSGLNFLATWQLWQQTRLSPDAHLHFVSVEGYPLSQDQLRAALAPWGELSDLSEQLIAAWPGRVRGMHRIDFSDGVSLTLCHDTVDLALANVEFKADSWFLDGFSPAKNPDMWSEAVIKAVFDHSADGASVGTFTVAGSVRRALSDAGFVVSKEPGFGRKRERLEAIKPGSDAGSIISTQIKKQQPPLIVGAGIAGASLARSFLRRGISPIIIDPSDDSAASGNLAAIVKPRLDLQDRPESRFYLAAYLYALNAYRDVEGGVYHQGIAHCARHNDDQARFEKLTAQAVLPPQHMQLASPDFIAQRAGVTPKRGGLWFDKALAIDPRKITQSWTQGAQRITAHVHALRRDGALWQAIGESGEILASSDCVYVTAGAGMSDLVPSLRDHIRYLGGQITWGEDRDNSLKTALVYGGYALRAGNQIITGATHDRLEGRKLYEILPGANTDNVQGFVDAGGLAAPIDAARSALRVTTLNTFPLIGQAGDGLYMMTGLGGRGFSFAPLLADHMAALYAQTPPGLTTRAHDRIWCDLSAPAQKL